MATPFTSQRTLQKASTRVQCHPLSCRMYGLLNPPTTSMRQGFCCQGCTCCAVSRPKEQILRECYGDCGCWSSSLALNLSPPCSDWLTWRKVLHHSVPLFLHLKTGAIMVSPLRDTESVKQNNRWIRVTESRCPEPTWACGIFPLHAYVRVHVSFSYWLCLGVLERPREGVDSCPEAR